MHRGSAFYNSSSNPYKHLLPSARRRRDPLPDQSYQFRQQQRQQSLFQRRRLREQTFSQQRQQQFEEHCKKGQDLWCEKCCQEVHVDNGAKLACTKCDASYLVLVPEPVLRQRETNQTPQQQSTQMHLPSAVETNKNKRMIQAR